MERYDMLDGALRLSHALDVVVRVNTDMNVAARYVPKVWKGRRLGHETCVEVNPDFCHGPVQPIAQRVLHELAHHLGPDIDTYHERRAEHEVFAQACVAYAAGFTYYDEYYLDAWYHPYRNEVDLRRVAAMVAIVGEHLRAALEVHE